VPHPPVGASIRRVYANALNSPIRSYLKHDRALTFRRPDTPKTTPCKTAVNNSGQPVEQGLQCRQVFRLGVVNGD
jgi:hypothetical protein